MTTTVTPSNGSTTADLETVISGCDSTTITTNALVMSGEISITHTSNVTYTDASSTFVLNEATCDRLLGHDLLAPQWYIKVTTDINSKISYCDDHSTDFCDDAWGISAGTWDQNGSEAKEYKLPNSQISDIKLATFDVCDENSTAHTYNLMANVTLDDQGDLSNTLDIVDNGEAVNGAFSAQTYTVTEDVNKAQTAYFDGSVCDGLGGAPSEPGPNDADVLTATLSQAQVCDDRASALSTIDGELSGSIITAWSISLDSAPLDTRSNLAKFARESNKTSADVFSNDDLIVMDTPFLYTVSMDDINSNTYLMANDYVYGVLKHSA